LSGAIPSLPYSASELVSLQMCWHNEFLKCNFTFCVSTIKNAMFQLFVCQICSLGSVVRAVRYITERLPVLIQAVRFCPSGESARTLFKSSESKLTLSNKQNRPHRGSHTEPPRGPTPLAPSVCERIFFHFCLTTALKQLCWLDWNETSERIVKMSTNLKLILNILKFQCTSVEQKSDFCSTSGTLGHVISQSWVWYHSLKHDITLWYHNCDITVVI